MAALGDGKLETGDAIVINRQEIFDFSRELGLAPDVVEKDYALGWLLAGIFQQPALRENWVFKGGTCLKKCYFETYRFSEDLDFTLKQPDHLRPEFLTGQFEAVAGWVYEHSGIEIPADTRKFELYTNPRGQPAIEGRLGYRGPLQRRGSVPRIKLDLTSDERLVLPPVLREVHHAYSDKPAAGIQALCYPYEELFAEKLRALTERMRPRDLYDVVHLYRHDADTCDRSLVLSTLREKCAFKGIAVPTAEALMARPERVELEAEWGNMLAHQLPQLPPLAQFLAELPMLFNWLINAVRRAVAPAMPVHADDDLSWRPPAMAQAWGMPVPLEIIRFAAANHLSVDLAYHGSRRLIEPYSLRRTQAGNIILHAIRHESGEHRSYRVDEIQGATATNVPFVPRYAVELTATGAMSIPATPARPSASYSARTSSSRPHTHFGPTYVIQCMVCGKRFSRRSYDTSLNPHKNKSGYDCFGRTGFLVETKY